LELDENLADAHFALAQYERDLWEWIESEHQYQRAIELNPNLSRAHGGYGILLSDQEKHQDAIAEAEREGLTRWDQSPM
jgi:Tfp pilus assembly protein PilF